MDALMQRLQDVEELPPHKFTPMLGVPKLIKADVKHSSLLRGLLERYTSLGIAMKYIFIIAFMFYSLTVIAKEDCSLKGIELDNSSNVAERLFYTGTCHYRNEDYALSANSWKKLAKLKNIEPEFKELQIDVLNNLGYLLFFGYGIKKNQLDAIGYWKQAVSMGHTESEYHLCHAYADSEESTYDAQAAKKHCEKALLIYRGMEDPDQEILKQIEKYSSQVNG